MLENGARENACEDLEEEAAANTVEEAALEAPVYNTRSGRTVNRHDYRSINKDNIQMNQIKNMVISKNPGVPVKELNKKINEAKRIFKKSSFKNIFRRLTGAMFSKISRDARYVNTTFRKGKNRHGYKSIEALLVELSQLDSMSTFNPMMVNDLSSKEKKMALNLLIIIREERCGKIKGRVTADGSNRRYIVAREDATLPKIQLESLIMSLLVDTKEGRDVAVSDVVGAYLLAKMKDLVLVKLTGEAVDVLCTDNEKYRKFVTNEKDKDVIY